MTDSPNAALWSVFCQTTLVFGFGLMALAAMRRSSGAGRSFVARAVFVVALAGVMLSFATSSIAPVSVPTSTVTILPASQPRSIDMAANASAEPHSGPQTVPASAPAKSAAIIRVLADFEWIPYVWLGGVLFLAALMSAGMLGIRGIVVSAEVVQHAESGRILEDLAERYGVRRPRLLESDRVHSPILTGWLRPAIIIPGSNDSTFDSESLRTIFAHELAHQRRMDCAWFFACRCMSILVWPNPLAWLMLRAQTESAEDACDEEAVLRTMPPRVYAQSLVRLSERFTEPIRGTLGVVGRESALRRRIQRILALNPESLRRVTAKAALPVVILTGCGLLGSYLWPMPAASQTPKKAASQSTPHYAQPPIQLAFEGVAEHRSGEYVYRQNIRYDRGKYWIEDRHGDRGLRRSRFDRSTLNDGAIVWELIPDLKLARPSVEAIHNRLAAEAKQTSSVAVREKYGLLDRYMPPLEWTAVVGGGPRLPHRFEGRYGDSEFKPTGRESVAGLRCRVLEYRSKMKRRISVSPDGRTIEGEVPRTMRVWVEQKTGLVLRRDYRQERVDLPHFQPVNISERMLTFRFRSSIPEREFRLPAGYTVEIPEPFRSVKLPRGVIRKEIPGIGMGGVTRPDVEGRIKHQSARAEMVRKRLAAAELAGDKWRVEKERRYLRNIEELITQLRQGLTAKPFPLPQSTPARQSTPR